MSLSISGTDYLDQSDIGIQMDAESGWGTPASAGDKSIALPDYAAGLDVTMQTALNVVSSGTGDAIAADEAQILALTQQLQSLITKLRGDGILTD